MKSKTLIIIAAIIAVIAIVLCCIFMLPNESQITDDPTISTEDTENNENTSTGTDISTEPTTEPTEPPPPEIKLELVNLKTGSVLDLTNANFDTLEASVPEMFWYVQEGADANTEIPEEMLNSTVAPESTQITVFIDDPQADQTVGSLYLGLYNSSTEPQKIITLPIIYFEYSGSSNWSMCGITTDMTYEQIIKAIGDPTQELISQLGKELIYDLERDAHDYKLTVTLDQETNNIKSVALHIDNIKLY